MPTEIADDHAVIAPYGDDATSEQCHSEFKTDLYLERVSSCKFDTNDLVIIFAVLAYNLLRKMRLRDLMGIDAPVHHKAKRDRLKTLIQELMYMACQVASSGQQIKLRFGKHCRNSKLSVQFTEAYSIEPRAEITHFLDGTHVEYLYTQMLTKCNKSR